MNASAAEAKVYYDKALSLGKKEGGAPLILDDILKNIGLKTPAEIPLGIQDIAIDQIAGTKTEGRKNCFSKSFYPLLDSSSEFADKWIRLCMSHLNEGIHDPIKVYEFMNEFYVIEGNKRVSILNYFDSVTIPADVIRILPPQIDQPDIKRYYEFLDFYNISQINYVYFTKEGSFQRLQRLIGKKRNEMWDDDDRLEFNSLFTRFRMEYIKLFGKQHYTVISDSLLYVIILYDYKNLITMSQKELKEKILLCKDELKLRLNAEPSKLQMDPFIKKKSPILNLVPLPKQKLKVAFIHDKSAERSGWTFNHDLGRQHLEKVFPENVTTAVYNNTDLSNIKEVLNDVIEKKFQVVFTTTPIFLKDTLKAAVEHPEIRFLNCTTHYSFKHVRTYYARMYEVKFLMGAIAGAMTTNDKIGYIADYPIYGTLSNINAFALGAKMINPRAKIHLKWSRLNQKADGSTQTIEDIYNYFTEQDIHIICDKDSLNSKDYSKRIGLYQIDENGIWNIAIPMWDWNVFYEKTISNILNGGWKSEENSDKNKGINYWWGMSSGIVDIISSGRLPIGTARLIELLKETIKQGNFNPFTGILYSQERVVQTDKDATLSPSQILEMDWLAENILGEIPAKKDLNETAQQLVEVIGFDKGEHIL